MDNGRCEGGDSSAVLEEWAAAMGCPLDGVAMARFDVYAGVLLRWNQRLNLTRITDLRDIYVKHFADSLALLMLSEFRLDERVLDLGSGAGFPGLALKIARPGLRVTLCDSLAKRVRFLVAAAEEVGVEVESVHGRAEELARRGAGYRDGFGVATARAVAPLRVLVEWGMPFVRPEGAFVAMKGPGWAEELADAKRAVALLGGEVERVVEYDLPMAAGERVLVVIRKTGRTPRDFPRRAGEASRNPL